VFLLIKYDSNIEVRSLKVYDLLGKLIVQENHNFNQIDVSKLRSGVYFLTINTTSGSLTKKIVKE